MTKRHPVDAGLVQVSVWVPVEYQRAFLFLARQLREEKLQGKEVVQELRAAVDALQPTIQAYIKNLPVPFEPEPDAPVADKEAHLRDEEKLNWDDIQRRQSGRSK